MTDDKVEELLLKVSSDISEIKTNIRAINKALYGNGHPGLVEQVSDLDRRITTIEAESRGSKHSWVLVGGLLAFVVSTVVNILGLFFGR